MIKQKYNYEYLQQFCKDNNIELVDDYSKDKITRDSIIQGKCKSDGCIGVFEKNFRLLILINGYCNNCSIDIGKEKKKKTCLNKFGVEYSLQNKEVREKGNDTIQKIYGVKYISQVPEIRNKAQTTMINRFGVSHALQSKELIEKSQNTMINRFGVSHASQNEDVKIKTKNTNLEKYGFPCASQNEDVKDKIKNTNLEKYGFHCALQNEDVKDKIKNTNLEKYGVEYATQNEDVKIKTKQTCLVNWGTEYYLQTDDKKIKSKETCLIKWGKEYYLQTDDKKIKSTATCLEKYGCEHPSQNIEVMDKMSKNAYKLKDYILPSGNIIKIQGYEHYALDELIQDGILEEDIINGCSNVPEIWYEDENTKNHRHYVDIFIPSQNRMVEVKSTWTAEKKKDNIFLKQEAGKKAGYLYEIWVYNGKGEKVECYI
jgi:hypothetical protein